MKKLGSILILGMVWLAAVPVEAQNQNVRLEPEEVINQDYFVAGEQVELAGTVNGDVYVAGGLVSITGTVNGDVLAAGGEVAIRGKVGQNVRVAGGQIEISGSVGRNVTMVGGTLEIDEPAQIVGNLVLAGGNVNVRGGVGGDVNAAIGNLAIGPKAVLGGQLNYTSNEEAMISKEAKITGPVKFYAAPVGEHQQTAETARKTLVGFWTGYKLASLLALVIIGLVLVKVLPQFSLATVETIQKRPGMSMLVGFGFVVLVPVVAIILAVTLIGLPLAFWIIMAYTMINYVTKIWVMYWLGLGILHNWQTKPKFWLAYLIGVVIYALVGLLPLVGWLVGFGVQLVGVGSVLLTQKSYLEKLQAKKVL